MEKQFNEFKAFVPSNFTDLMIQYWMRDENVDRDTAIGFYLDDGFKALSSRISNTYQTFKPDLGYSHRDTNGRLCFEIEDNNFVIPVEVLEEYDNES